VAKPFESIPNPNKTLEALRNLDYSLQTAIADLIDNSISANSRNIRIKLAFLPSKREWHFSIIDDGNGMDLSTLREAMRIGSEMPVGNRKLGKFGMGLKTASLSQSRIFTVMTRKDKAGQLQGAQWNLDNIEKSNKWEFYEIEKKSLEKLLNENGYDRNALGTIVVWEKMDKLDKEYSAEQRGMKLDQKAQEKAVKLMAEVELYIGLVFYRYLLSGARQVVNIYFNDNKVGAIDPFAQSEQHTEVVQLGDSIDTFYPLETKVEKSSAPIKINAFILPKKEDFSSPDAWTKTGLGEWNRSQGYYIFREDRLINYGTWLRTRQADEHTKLARIAIDIPREYDDLIGLNVQKKSVRLPQSLLIHLKEKVNSVVTSEADKKYRSKHITKQDNIQGENSTPNHARSSDVIESGQEINRNFTIQGARTPEPIDVVRERLQRLQNDASLKKNQVFQDSLEEVIRHEQQIGSYTFSKIVNAIYNRIFEGK